MIYGESGSNRQSWPDDLSTGRIIIAQSPGLASQSDEAPCLKDVITDIAEKKFPDAGNLLDGTVQANGEVTQYDGQGAVTMRQCGRSACKAECMVAVGANYRVKDLKTSTETAPELNCIEHPWQRRHGKMFSLFKIS